MSTLKNFGFLLLAAGLGAGTAWIAAGQGAASADGGHDFSVARIDASWAFDRDNLSELAGASDAMFIAKVSKQLKTEVLASGPQTYYDAEVIFSFKGSAQPSSVVQLSQESGYDAESNTLYLFEGDPLLEEDRVYLVAARMNEDDRTYNVIPVAGTQDVTDLNASQVAAFKAKYARAVSNQIPLAADIGRR